MYDKSFVNGLTETVQRLADEKHVLEDKHWSECAQIAQYDDEIKFLRKECLDLINENTALRLYISEQETLKAAKAYSDNDVV
jgi:hypothetical protein